MRTTLKSLPFLGVLAVLALAGCSLGPTALKSGRTTYNVALQRSANEQILLNLVRLKYREPTSFIEIGSISASSSFSLGATVSNIQPNSGNQSATAAGSAGYSETPTITYSPLQGEQFAKRLMSELDIKTFLLLLRAGWNPSRLMRLTVEHLGELDNDPTLKPLAGEQETAYTRFVKFTKLLTDLHMKGALHFGLGPGKAVRIGEAVQKEGLKPAEIIAANKDGYDLLPHKEGAVEIVKAGPPSLVIEANPSEAERAELSDYLKFSAERRPQHVAESQSVLFYLDKGPMEEPVEVPLQLRSYHVVLYYLAQGIEAPAADIEKGYVKTHWRGPNESAGITWEDWRKATVDLLDVRCSLLPPRGAFVSVEYRGYWFYIGDSDIKSKDTFALLYLIFALEAGEVPSMLPILTIPVSGPVSTPSVVR
jgi:hypothetical protein